MKRVYSSDDFLMVGALRSDRQVLEDHHVACVIKNEHLIGGAGELPPTECWPELWIAEDALLDKAMGLVQAFVASSRQPPPATRVDMPGLRRSARRPVLRVLALPDHASRRRPAARLSSRTARGALGFGGMRWRGPW